MYVATCLHKIKLFSQIIIKKNIFNNLFNGLILYLLKVIKLHVKGNWFNALKKKKNIKTCQLMNKFSRNIFN